EVRMMDVRGYDRAPGGYFAPHVIGVKLLALGHVGDLLAHHAKPRQMHLRHVPRAVAACLSRFALLDPVISQSHENPLQTATGGHWPANGEKNHQHTSAPSLLF